MKKIYTLSMAMMLAALPAMAQQQTMKLHSPSRPLPAHKMQGLKSAAYNAPETATVKKAVAQADASMTLGYCGDQYTAYGVGLGEDGVGVMFSADYLKDFVGNQITAINVAAPFSAKLSTNQVQKNALTKAKIMICNEMNGTPVVESSATLGDQAFVYNELKFDTPYTIEAGKDVYLYVEYENPSTSGEGVTDYIIIVDGAQAPASPDAGYLKSYFAGFNQQNQIMTQDKLEWKQFADLLGANFCITATVTGDNLPENIGTPLGAEPQINIKPNQEFDMMVAVQNGGSNVLENVELTLNIGDQPAQSVTARIFDSQGGMNPVNFGQYGIAVAKFTCTTEGAYIPYALSVTKVNGVENTQAAAKVEGTFHCLETGYPMNVVIEEFTSTTCPYCPIGITGLEQVKAKYEGRVIPMAAHYSQANKDPMNVCDSQSDCYYGFVQDIVAAQGGAGAPSAFIMRNFDNNVYPSPDELEYYMEQWTKVEAIAEVKATVEPTADEKSVTLNVTVTPALDSKSEYGISYTIVEDELGPYRQTNGYSGQSGNFLGWQNKPASVSMLFNDIVRPGSKYRPVPNSTMKEMKKGEAKDWTTTVDVSAVKNLENYHIVAMLINKSNGHIENAFQAAGVPSGIEAVAAEGKAVAAGMQGGVNMFTTGNIYTIDGRAVAMGVNGMVELPAGLYIVATPAGNAKVMVR